MHQCRLGRLHTWHKSNMAHFKQKKGTENTNIDNKLTKAMAVLHLSQEMLSSTMFLLRKIPAEKRWITVSTGQTQEGSSSSSNNNNNKNCATKDCHNVQHFGLRMMTRCLVAVLQVGHRKPNKRNASKKDRINWLGDTGGSCFIRTNKTVKILWIQWISN